MSNDGLSNVTQAYLNAYYLILDTMVQRMTSVQLTYSISHNFIQQMIPHHQAAIEMSKNILKYTTNLEVKSKNSLILTEGQISEFFMVEITTKRCALLFD